MKVNRYSFNITGRIFLAVIFLLVLSFDLVQAQTTWTIGSGTTSNASNTYPAPFGNNTRGARQQFLYRASDLTAAGMTAGLIHQIGFNVTALNGCGSISGFTIKIKNANSSSSLSAFETMSLSTVYNGNYQPVTGWNMFTLSTPFNWNGTSAILIDVCYYSSGATANASTEWSTVVSNTSRYVTTTSSSMICNTTMGTTGSSSRPNIKFLRNPQTYTSSTVVQVTGNVPAGAPSNPVIGIRVVMNGSDTPLNLTQLNLNTTGSTNPSGDISSAKIYYTGTTNSFSVSNLYGSSSSPNGSFNITGSQSLANGTNYFWLAYDIKSGAVISNTLDAQCTQITLGGNNYTPTETNPSGSKTIIASSTTVIIGSGTGSNGANEYPAPFGNFYMGARHQFIYRAAELSDAGFTAGEINRFGFNVIAVNGSGIHDDFSIKMKNSTVNNLTGFQEDFRTVLLPVDHQPVDGWNMFNLDSAFTWDGISNLIVEVCFYTPPANAPPNGYTNNASTEWSTNLGTGTSRYQNNDNEPAICTDSTGNNDPQVTQTRPNAKIERLSSQSYASGTVIQPLTTNIFAGSTNTVIIALQVVVDGNANPLSFTKLSLNTTGSTNPSDDITNAKVYYTGTSSTFSASNLFGSFVSPNGTFEITGTQSLSAGTNYFWITYDISSGSQSGNLVDAQCTQITIAGNNYVPSVTDPAGSRTIVIYASETATVGSGTTSNGSAENPAAFANNNRGSRQQYIYTASELTSAGLTAGPIDKLGFNVTSLNGSGVHSGYSVKMKNSSTVTLAAFETGMTTVLNPADYQPVAGWNMLTLNNSFEWDGTSNIIVEICFYSPAGTASASTEWTTGLSGDVSRYITANFNSNVCNTTTNAQVSSSRPNARFFRDGNQTYTSSNVIQPVTGSVTPGAFNASVIAVQVEMNGGMNVMNLTDLNFNTTGSTSPSTDIVNAKVFYTGTSSSFSASTQFGSTVSSPNGTFTITGSQSLQSGVNYFWLAYDISGSAVQGNTIDAVCTQITVGGITRTPSVTSPSGSRTITPSALSATIGTGTGSNGDQEYPAPFGNYYMGARHQFIYRASELTASGFAGIIERFGFNVVSVNGAGVHKNFSIKMKNSSTDSLAQFESGLTTVLNPVDYQPVEGWNMFILDTPFEWDGVSNIIVETCFYTDPYTLNASTQWTTGLGGGTSRFVFNDSSPGICSDISANVGISGARPNARFAKNSNQIFSSGTTIQPNTGGVPAGASNVSIIALKINIDGNSNPLTLTQIIFNTAGTTNPSADILNAKVYYTGNSSVFSISEQFGSTAVSPNGAFTVTGTKQLLEGENYFWVAYDISSGTAAGHQFDAQCTQFTIAGIDHTPDVTNPTGARLVALPLSGNYVISAALFSTVSGIDLPQPEIKKDASKKAVIINDGVTKYNTAQNITLSHSAVKENGNNLFYKFSGGEQNSTTGETDYEGVFATITAALEELNGLGVGGPVVFTLADETYPLESFPLIINPVSNDPTALNTVTFQPAAGKNVSITGNDDIIKIQDCGYITINGNPEGNESLTLESTDGLKSVIRLSKTNSNTEHNITVKNTSIVNVSPNSGGFGISTDQYLTTGAIDSIKIQNNIFKRCSYGITMYGTTASSQNITNVVISGNDLSASGSDAIGSSGIFFVGVNGALISGNNFGNFDGSYNETDIGIWLQIDTYNITIERNKIFNINYAGTSGYGAIGIYVTSEEDCNIIIKNNVIYNLTADGSDFFNGSSPHRNVLGIYLEANQSKVKVYNNSINLYGNSINQSNALSAGIAILGAVSDIDIRNNSIVNNLGRAGSSGFGAIGIFWFTGVPPNSIVNYNNIYVNPTGGGQKLIGKIDAASNSGNTYTTLAAWRSGTSLDLNSVSNNPGYTSDTNLLPDGSNTNSWTLNGKGLQIASVNNDYAGNPRSISAEYGAPDIGAYEFTPSVPAPTSTQSAPPANNASITFSFAGNTLGTLAWGSGGTVPSAMDFQFFSGTNPPGFGNGYSNAYWSVTPTGGSGYSYNITFQYDETMLGNISSESMIRVSKSEDNGSNWINYFSEGTGPGQYQLNTTNNTITLYGLTNFSLFTLTDASNPLPVELSSFTASSERLNAEIKWSTSNEIDNYGFEVERAPLGSTPSLGRASLTTAPSIGRTPLTTTPSLEQASLESTSGESWEKVGFVKGNGTSNSTKEYSFKDKNLSAGNYKYRLKQIDNDGKFKYSEAIEIAVGSAPHVFNLAQNYPNPFNPETLLEFTLPENGQATLKIYNITGEEVATLFNEITEAGKYHQVRFNASDLASGVYFARLHFSSPGGSKSNLMVKKMLYLK